MPFKMKLVKIMRNWGWLLGAVAVFFSGYFPLLMMWLNGYGERGPDRPGFFAYPSATWGDGVCLPLMAAALIWMNRQLSTPGSVPFRLAGGVLGAAGGTFVIIAWLIDSSPVLNWTTPGPHSFNEPGKAHAVFFIAASSFFGLLWANLFAKLRRTFRSQKIAEGQVVLGSLAFAVAVGTAASFAMLVAVDNMGTMETRASSSSFISLVLVVSLVTVGLVWSAGKNVRHSTSALISAAMIAVTIVSLALLLPLDFVVIAFVVAAAGFGLAVGLTGMISESGKLQACRSGERGSPTLELVVCPALFLLVPLQASLTKTESINELYRVLLSFLLVFLAVLAFRYYRRGSADFKRDFRWLFAASLFVIVTSGALTFSKLGTIDGAGVATSLAFATLAAILAGPTIRLCDIDVQALIRVQNDPQFDPAVGFTRLHLPIAWRLCARLGACLVAAGASVLGLTFLTGYAVKWNRGGTSITVIETEMLCFVAALIGSLVLGVWAYINRRKQSPTATTSSRIFVSVGIYLTSAALVLIPILGGAPIDGWAALQSLGLALFAGECIFGNGLRLGLVKPGVSSFAALLAASTGLWALAYWSLTEGIGTTSAPVLLVDSFMAVLGAVALAGIFTIATTSVIFGHTGQANRSFKMRAGNATQDLLMLAPMWILMAWLPRTIFVHIPNPPIAPYKWVMVGMVFVGFLSLYITALLWLIKNNDGHVGRRMKRFNLSPIDDCYLPKATHWKRLVSIPDRLKKHLKDDLSASADSRAVRALGSHTAVQNVISLAVVASTIVGALWLAVTDWEV